MLVCGECVASPPPLSSISSMVNEILKSVACCVLTHYRANAQQPKLFVGMILILIFAEALALYGLIGELSWGLLML